MSNIYRRSFIGMLVLAVLALTLAPWSLQAKPPKTEDELIADLASPLDGVVTDALQKLEKGYPDSTKARPVIKKLLADPRTKVARKAARVLGVLHAEVSEADLNNICALLKSSDTEAQLDALKALRGLKAASTIPQILPLLKSPVPNVVRDACRTLAVLGDKSIIPSLEPLLKDPNSKIQKDAQDAIFALKAKS